jgi:DNA anti-recombination protein RmuC
MSEIKDVNKKVDELEAAAKKYMSKDTVISIGGYEFTPAKLMVAATIVSSTLGALYGAFEVYKDYQGMKDKIAKYVAPDLSELHKKMELTMQNSEKSVQYTQDIKNDLKQDIRRLEKIVEQVERDGKQLNREVDQDLRQMRREVDQKIQKAMDNPLAK